MAKDRRYKRYFIILENEDRGFEKADKRTPKGYAKIEVRNGKGLLNVYVQDLKYFKDAKYIYRNYLISTKGDKSVFVDTGSFAIDEKGKGELKVKFNPDNVEGSKRTIEDFNVVAVIAKPIERSSEQNEVFGPLVGYMDKEKINWKDVVINENKEPEENDELDEEYKEKYEEIIDVIEKSSKELYKEDNEDNEENKENIEKQEKKEPVEDKKYYKKGYNKEYKNKEYNKDYYEDMKKESDDCVDSLEKYDNQKVEAKKQEENKENIKATKEEKKEINYKHENKKAVKPKENKEVKEKKHEKKEAVKEEKKEKTKKADSKDNFNRKSGVHYKKYHKMVYKYVKDILKHYERVEPFEKNIESYSWWRIPYNEQTMHRGFLPFFGYILSSCYFNPYIYHMNNCQNLMSKYGHYIFGIVYDKDMEQKHYVYGVPGRYMYMDQPFQGMTGFVYWYPLENKTPEQGDYGYWMLHIDAKTGNVVFPIKPTGPPIY